MPEHTEYKVIQGAPMEIEKQLNELSKEGWRPITMGGLSIGVMVAVVLEKKAS